MEPQEHFSFFPSNFPSFRKSAVHCLLCSLTGSRSSREEGLKREATNVSCSALSEFIQVPLIIDYSRPCVWALDWQREVDRQNSLIFQGTEKLYLYIASPLSPSQQFSPFVQLSQQSCQSRNSHPGSFVLFSVQGGPKWAKRHKIKKSNLESSQQHRRDNKLLLCLVPLQYRKTEPMLECHI